MQAAVPLHSMMPHAAYEVREVTCPACAGDCEHAQIVNLHSSQDERRIGCRPCRGTGKVIAHVGTVDGELYAWCEATRLLAAVDEAELESGDWRSAWPADRFNLTDRMLMSELGAQL